MNRLLQKTLLFNSIYLLYNKKEALQNKNFAMPHNLYLYFKISQLQLKLHLVLHFGQLLH